MMLFHEQIILIVLVVFLSCPKSDLSTAVFSFPHLSPLLHWSLQLWWRIFGGLAMWEIYSGASVVVSMILAFDLLFFILSFGVSEFCTIILE